jgi:hypothetical protein
MISKGGINVFIYRGDIFRTINSISALIFGNFLKPLAFVFFIFFYILYKYRYVKNTILLLVLGCLALLYNFPTGQARFYMFTLLVVFYTLFFLKRTKKSSYILLIYLVIAIFLSSFLGLFRNMQDKNIVNSITSYEFDTGYFFVGNFDAYEIFVLTFNYVLENSITYGYNMISALLFFVPRDIWSDKSIGSGAWIADKYSKIYVVHNTNISNPFISEWYLNFGIIGIITSSIIYAFFSGKLDRIARIKLRQKGFETEIFLVLYSAILGLFFFHLRGDMMSSCAYFSGFMLSFVIALYILNIKLKIFR